MDKAQWQNRGSGRRNRLRQRFLDSGLRGFSDTEILEVLLSFGTPRKDCKEQAQTLLKRFETFPGVLDATHQALLSVEGIGPKSSFALGFVKSTAEHYLRQRLRTRHYLQSSAQVIDYLSHSLRGLQVEVFTVIYLDAALAIIDSEKAAEGTVTVNTVYPREIIKKALSHNASALIVAHNHPSGVLNPSKQDHQLTKQLYLACSMMHIRLLDHLIIGDGHFSFADAGIIDQIADWCASVTRSPDR
ncbi:MAG: DNA repair protein RadC [Desulfofustis sp.]|nr:DNA repair protein RadC [Desulfofustis sp.]MBT8354915.1 DNA repair protein RadC [Desulfofustis sp.]NNK58465.1 DNA repair protein RadC [Desulfofustis sp.]RZW19958.1 MAG: DNA repair protein RadC [Desulfobulbaceae bacterium]